MAVVLRWQTNNNLYPEDEIRVYRGQPTLDINALPAPLVTLAGGSVKHVDITTDLVTEYQYLIAFERAGVVRYSAIMSVLTLPEQGTPVQVDVRAQAVYVIAGKAAPESLFIPAQKVYAIVGKAPLNTIFAPSQVLYVVTQ